jgi:hypothetical protein
MKRVKVMLSAILVLALVAGALAFKAKKATYCLYTLKTYTTAPNQPVQTTCTSALLVDDFSTGEKHEITNAFSTIAVPCPQVTFRTNCSREITYQLEQ